MSDNKISQNIEPGTTSANASPEPQKGSVNQQDNKTGWYVIHSHAGYEDQVAESIMQRAQNLQLKDYIFEVIVPKEKHVEIRNGRKRVTEKRSFPGYVFVNMKVTDESWYVVRNTPNVTGFLGSGVHPTPIPDSEIASIRAKMAKDEPEHVVDLREGDLVRIADGPLKGYEGKVIEIDANKGKIKVSVSMFGRETPVNLDFLQVKKV